MSGIQPMRQVTYFAPVVDRIVVPTDTAAISIAAEEVLSATDVGSWVDAFLVPESVAITGNPTPRQSAATYETQRAIYVLDAGSTMMSSAPRAVTRLLSALASASADAYILETVSGNIWIVSKAGYSGGLRRGVYNLLRQAGSDWGGGAPEHRVRQQRATLVPARTGLFQPAVGLYRFEPEGGPGAGNVPPLATAAAQKAGWQNWKIALGPYEFAPPIQQGENVCYARQYEYNHDHRYMAWRVATQDRGHYDSGAWPGVPLPSTPTVLTHWNASFHGSGGGALPASAGAAPWVSPPSVPATNSALASDTNPDADTDPAPTDFDSWNGTPKLVGDYLIGLHRVATSLLTNTIKDPAVQYISVEASDGSFVDESTKGRRMLRDASRYAPYLTTQQKQSDANNADAETHLANMLSLAIASTYSAAPWKPKVGRLGYNEHGAPPSIPVYPGNLVMVLDGVVTGRSTPLEKPEIRGAWAAKSALNASQGFGTVELGVEPIWQQTLVGFYCTPRTDQRQEALDMQAWMQVPGFRGINAQSSYTLFCLGLLYWLVGRLCDEPALNVDSAIAQFYTTFLGAAGTRVQAMQSRHWQSLGGWYEYSANEIGAMYADMLAAQTELDGAPNATQQAYLDGVYKCGVHYQRLHLEFINAAYYAVTLTTSGPASPTVVALPVKLITTAVYDLRLRITSGHAGADGVAQFDYSLNGGANWSAGGTIPAGGVTQVTLPGSSFVLVFGVGTYNASTTWARDFTAIDTAADALLSFMWSTYTRDSVDANRMATGMRAALPATLASCIKWDYTNGAAAGWATAVMPSSAALQALMVSGAATYAPIVTRTKRSALLKPAKVATSTTPVNTVTLVDPADWAFLKPPSGDLHFDALLYSPYAGGNQPMRFIVCDAPWPAGNVLQTITIDIDLFIPSTAGASPVKMFGLVQQSTTVRVRIDTATTFAVSYNGGSTYAHTGIAIPAAGERYDLDGIYLHCSVDFLGASYTPGVTYDLAVGQNRNYAANAVTVGVPGQVLYMHTSVNDRVRQYRMTFEERAGITQTGVQKLWANDYAQSFNFWVERGTTTVVFCGQLTQDPIVKNDAGATITVTKVSPTTFSFPVASGHDNAEWSISNVRTIFPDFPLRFENCANVLGFSANQMLIPVDTTP